MTLTVSGISRPHPVILASPIVVSRRLPAYRTTDDGGDLVDRHGTSPQALTTTARTDDFAALRSAARFTIPDGCDGAYADHVACSPRAPFVSWYLRD